MHFWNSRGTLVCCLVDNLTLNASKLCSMYSLLQFSSIFCFYSIGGQHLSFLSSFLSLGATNDKANSPFVNIVNLASNMYDRFLHFSFHLTTIQAFSTLLNCLENWSVIWSSFRNCDCLTLEVVIRKILPIKNNLSSVGYSS